jgi:hypothetical protein
MRSFGRFIMDRYRRAYASPNSCILAIRVKYPSILKILSRLLRFDFLKFIDVNRIAFENSIVMIDSEIRVVIVVTLKDIDVLPFAIMASNDTLSNFTKISFTIICPQKEKHIIELALSEISLEMEIIVDESLINEENIQKIVTFFGVRSGWVIQQILKNEYARKSTHKYILLLDSDTLLLKQRNWINTSGEQLLMPTEESHQPYYDFLSRFGLPANQSYSFVSHHMLIQPDFLREMFYELNIQNQEDFIERIISCASNSSSSPFCIDYEMYAQYLLVKHPDKVYFGKWSNLSYPRQKILGANRIETRISSIGKDFASVSLHSWS